MIEFHVGDRIRFHQDDILDGIGTVVVVNNDDLCVYVEEIIEANVYVELHSCSGIVEEDHGWYVRKKNVFEIIASEIPIDIQPSDLMDILQGF